jgi:hypothetical protein
VTRLQIAILSFGIVNASLYSALLPLWEGFDEPAHYIVVTSTPRTSSPLRTDSPIERQIMRPEK